MPSCVRVTPWGVFQFESRGMKDLLQKARPDCFEDIIALVALYRPGPCRSFPSLLNASMASALSISTHGCGPYSNPLMGSWFTRSR